MNTKIVRTLMTNRFEFRLLTALLLVGLLAVALSACGGTRAAPTAVPTVAPATATPTVVPPTATVAPTAATEVTAPAAVLAPPSTDVTEVDESGNTTIDPQALDSALTEAAQGVLSDAEVEGLLYMREEEKLARDVYLTLYEKWEMPIFQNISDSEATHMEAVKTLIDRYDLADPAEDKAVGVFVDETLQGLYDQLVAEGSQSLASALRVGAAMPVRVAQQHNACMMLTSTSVVLAPASLNKHALHDASSPRFASATRPERACAVVPTR